MELNKINTALEYEFILKHKNLKQYYENYFKYKDVLNNKYDLYTLVYIKNISHHGELLPMNDDELFIYLGINNNFQHVFILCDIKLNLVYHETTESDNQINKTVIINKVNVPEEIYQKYINCLIKTYDVLGF